MSAMFARPTEWGPARHRHDDETTGAPERPARTTPTLTLVPTGSRDDSGLWPDDN